MEHTRSVLIKLLMISVITLAVLTLYGNISAASAVSIAVVITLAAYLLGDLWILPNFGNLIASVADGILAFLITWLSPLVMPGLFIAPEFAAAIGVITGIGEWFFHKYFSANILDEQKKEG